MDPGFASAHDSLGFVHLQMGRYDLWLDEWRKATALGGDKEEAAIADEVAKVYGQSGLHAALVQEVELYKQLAKRRYVDPGTIGYQYAKLGDKDQAFAWLEKAYTEKAGSLQNIKIAPSLDSLYADPRYSNLLNRMGLPR